MHAAVVESFTHPPRYREFPDPQPMGTHDTIVDVLAAGLHPRVRSQADGSHYTSTDQLPLVPGIDGVGRDPDGRLVYFILPDTHLGSMADRVAIDARRSIAVADHLDPVVLAAAMNPAMSSWIALRRRVDLRPGQRVLILGATGAAGQLAVQVARHLGASEVIAAGRDERRLAELPALGADATVSVVGPPDEIAARLGHVAGDVDVVLDYVWGLPAHAAMLALVRARTDAGRLLRWIQIGSTGGATMELPSAALRAANLHVLGSGQGSVATADILAELPGLAQQIANGAFTINARAVPLGQVEAAWTAPTDATERVVLVPDMSLLDAVRAGD